MLDGNIYALDNYLSDIEHKELIYEEMMEELREADSTEYEAIVKSYDYEDEISEILEGI